jgi:tetratricopeptide (TPR) repeat protein
LYSTIGQYEKAIDYLNKALILAKTHDDADIEIAVTYTNIGQAYTKLARYDEAEKNLKLAEEIFEKTDKKNYHYSGCANAFGALYYVQGDYEQACRYYEESLLNMHDTVGRTANYRAVYDDLLKAYKKAGKPVYDDMMSLCQGYYETYGRPMIQEKFPEYVDKIAVGLCGEGSECYGFDDDISLDHDCGPGFAMYVTEETYEKIGQRLSEEYSKLPRIFAGHIRQEMDYAKGRIGVNTIDGFFNRVLGGRTIPKTDNDWRGIPEYALACAVNGRVFTDPEGIFTEKRRELLSYYPENVWREKLAQELIQMAQTGQYNYGRMMARGEYVTVQVILGEYMQHLMNFTFLLNKTYAPYYKWTHRAMKKLSILPELAYIMEAISDMPSQREAWRDVQYKTTPNDNDMVAMTIEIVARMITDKLNEMGLTKSRDTYLETQGREVLKGSI